MTDTEFGDVAIPGWSREIAEALVRDVLALRIKYGLPLTLEDEVKGPDGCGLLIATPGVFPYAKPCDAPAAPHSVFCERHREASTGPGCPDQLSR